MTRNPGHLAELVEPGIVSRPLDSGYTFVSGGIVSQLYVELVAADRKVWEGEAKQVSARTVEGDLGILPGHTPLLGILVTGEVRIHSTAGSTHTATIDAGFLSVDHDRVTIVAETVDASQLSA
jgi:F-type H+-transporting ATPase subunit epsilon